MEPNHATEMETVEHLDESLQGLCGQTSQDILKCPLGGLCHAEAKRYADELAQHAKALARSNESLEQFACVASHDLQEPLHKITNYARLLSLRCRQELPPDAERYIDNIIDVAGRMRTLVHDLLAYSRISKESPTMETVDLAAVVTQVVADLEAVIAQAGAEVSHDELPKIRANSALMRELFQNLIQNAIKFRGKTTPRVHISVERLTADWKVSVRDNGIGVAPVDFERIFALFQRSHSKADYPGSGVGLAICRKIVEQHGGRIWVDSVLDRGSTFQFTIPIHEIHEAGSARAQGA